MNLGFGFFTLPQLAEALLLSKSTVKRLVRAGLIAPRYQLLSGRSYRLVFEPAEVIRFINEYYPTSEDLDLTRRPRSRRADRLRRLRNMHQVSIGRVNAMHRAKKDGPKAQEKEPVIVDQRPSGGPRSPRGSKVQTEGERGDERSLWSSRDDEDEET